MVEKSGKLPRKSKTGVWVDGGFRTPGNLSKAKHEQG